MKSIIKILLFISTLFQFICINSCNNKEDYFVANLNHNILMILGHKGMGDHFQYPGNTVESILPVLEIGADGSEIDVQLTRDSVLVLFHNAILDGRTNCTDKIYDHNWDDIKNCTYLSLHSDVKLISVDELFSRVNNLNSFYFSFDCKLDEELYYDNEYRKKFLMAVKRINIKYEMSRNIFLEGDLNFLLLAKELGLKNKGFMIGSDVNTAINNNIFGVGATLDTSPDTIKYAHNNGIYVMMWGAKTDNGNKQALKLNPDILQTDKPIPLLMLLDRMNHESTMP